MSNWVKCKKNGLSMQLKLILLSLIILGSDSLLANSCDAYYSFDGKLKDSGANGYDGQLITKGGEPASGSAKYGSGKLGQALKLDGSTFVRTPLDLSPEQCPQLTIALWMYIDADNKKAHTLLSNGNITGGITLSQYIKTIKMRGGRHQFTTPGLIRPKEWVFIASSWDFDTKKMTLQVKNRRQNAVINTSNMDMPDPYTWIGTYNDYIQWPAEGMLIDELHVFSRILSRAEIATLRKSNTVSAAGDYNTTVPEALAGRSCSNVQCPTGQVCSQGQCFDIGQPIISDNDNQCGRPCEVGKVCFRGSCVYPEQTELAGPGMGSNKVPGDQFQKSEKKQIPIPKPGADLPAQDVIKDSGQLFEESSPLFGESKRPPMADKAGLVSSVPDVMNTKGVKEKSSILPYKKGAKPERLKPANSTNSAPFNGKKPSESLATKLHREGKEADKKVAIQNQQAEGKAAKEKMIQVLAADSEARKGGDKNNITMPYTKATTTKKLKSYDACADVSCPTGQSCLNGGCFDKAEDVVLIKDVIPNNTNSFAINGNKVITTKSGAQISNSTGVLEKKRDEIELKRQCEEIIASITIADRLNHNPLSGTPLVPEECEQFVGAESTPAQAGSSPTDIVTANSVNNSPFLAGGPANSSVQDLQQAGKKADLRVAQQRMAKSTREKLAKAKSFQKSFENLKKKQAEKNRNSNKKRKFKQVKLGINENTTGVSGVTGTTKESKQLSGEALITALKIGAIGSEACDVTILSRNIPKNWKVKGSSSDEKELLIGSGCARLHLFSSKSVIWASLSQPIKSIQVCKDGSSRNQSVRGVRVWGGKLKITADEKGNQTANIVDGDNDLGKNGDCKKWKQFRSCKNGSIATGVVSYTNDKKQLVGLKLICRPVEFEYEWVN